MLRAAWRRGRCERGRDERELRSTGSRVFYRRVAGEGTPTRLLPRQPDPRRGLAAVPRARRPGDRDRHARLGPLGPARPGALRLLDVRALGLPRALPRRARRRPAQAGRPRLGRAGADRRPAAAGAGRAAGRHQRRAAAARLPLALGRRRSGAAGGSASSPTRPRPGPSLALLHAPGPRRPQPDAARVRRHDLEPLGPGHQRGDPRPLPPRRPRPPRRGRRGPRPARLPRAGPLGRPRPLPPDRASPRPTPSALPNAELRARPRRRPLALDRRPPRRRSTAVARASSPERRAAAPIAAVNGRITIARSCLVPSPRSEPSCPRAGATPAASSGILVLVDIAYELVRGIADGQRAERDRPRPAGDRLRALDPHLLRAQPAGVLPARPLADRLRQPALPQRPVLDRARLPGLALPLPQRVLLLRAQHVRGLDGPGAGRLHALPDRAAADVPRARLRRHDHRLLQRQPRLRAGEDLHQPLRGGAEHALRLRADDRRHRRHGLPPLVRESLLGALAAADRLGRDRHRQPLLGRRRARLDGRRRPPPLVAQRLLARARPEAWAWRPRRRRKRPRRSDPPAQPPAATSLTSNGIFGAPQGPRRSPQRPPAPATGRSCAPTPATG